MASTKIKTRMRKMNFQRQKLKPDFQTENSSNLEEYKYYHNIFVEKELIADGKF
tara:strand:+ start:975 stop:1136 length:162 start_codon:yes stop_codon:yes gene_type:complete